MASGGFACYKHATPTELLCPGPLPPETARNQIPLGGGHPGSPEKAPLSFHFRKKHLATIRPAALKYPHASRKPCQRRPSPTYLGEADEPGIDSQFGLQHELSGKVFLHAKSAPTYMVALAGNPDVLAQVVARVLATGATEFEVEYKDGEELVVAFSGAVGIGVAAFRSNSDDAQDLRQQLYALKKKRRKIIHAGVEYGLRVKIFDSFGEDAFRVTIARS